MAFKQPASSLKLIISLLLGAVGLALIIIGLGGTTGWLLIAIGCIAVVISLISVWVIQAPEINAAAEAAQPPADASQPPASDPTA